MRAHWIGFLALLLGCPNGEKEDVGPVGPTDAGGISFQRAQPPAAPSAPVLTPCPVGWRLETQQGQEVCEPRPANPVADCEVDEALLPGKRGCLIIGTSCPQQFPLDLPPGADVVYVSQGAVGGDGTAAHPYGSLGEALVYAHPEGTIIAIGRGRYDEPTLYPSSGLTLWGACVRNTVISSTQVAAGSTLLYVDGTLMMKNLRLENTGGIGLVVDGASASVTVEDVVIKAANAAGILVQQGGALSATNLVVRDTRLDAAGSGGTGIMVFDGTLEVAQSVFEDNAGAGVFVEEAIVAIEASSFRSNRGEASDEAVRGGLGANAAELDVQKSLFEGNGGMGILAQGSSVVRLEDLLIVDTGRAPAGTGRDGIAVDIKQGASATATRVRLMNNVGADVSAWGEGTTITLSHAVHYGGGVGRGLQVIDGASVDLHRAVMEQHCNSGVVTSSSSAILSDLVVRNLTCNEPQESIGVGIAAVFGGRAEVTRAIVDRALMDGIHVWGTTTGSNTASTATGRPSRVVLTDVTVRNTQGELITKDYGNGVMIASGAEAQLLRVLVDHNHDNALGVWSGTAQLEHVRISNTLPCQAVQCVEEPAGMALGAYRGSHLEAKNFEVEEAHLCGVQLTGGSTVTLENGVVSKSAIGACVQVDNYNFELLKKNVQYFENGTNLQATSLPVPKRSELNLGE